MKRIIIILLFLLFEISSYAQIMVSSYQAANHVPNFITGGMTVRYEIAQSASYSGTTTVTDLMGNVNATLYNSPTYNSTGTKYLNFVGGSSNYILTGNIGSTYNESVFMWVYPTGNGVILSELGQASINNSYHNSNIEMVSGTLKFSIWNSATITSSIATPLNMWHYIGFTYNGTTLTAYVNGAIAGSTIVSRTPPTNLYFGIGATDTTNMGSGGGYGNFRLGAFHYYKRGLSLNEVSLNYNKSKSNYINSVIFSQSFVSGMPPGASVETAFNTFRSSLTDTYTSFSIYSNLNSGITVTDPVNVPLIANALRTGTAGSWTIGGNVWKVALNCGTPSIGGASVVFTNSTNGCSCSTGTIYTIRPHINNNNWGGIGGECTQPTQTLTLLFY